MPIIMILRFGNRAQAAIMAASGVSVWALGGGWGGGLLAALGLGLAIEAARWRFAKPLIADPSRLPDGEIDWVEIAGVVASANTVNPGIRKFEAWDAEWRAGPRTLRTDARAPLLWGRLTIVSLFIGQDGRSWTDDETARVLHAAAKAGRWMERQAIRWRAELNVELSTSYFVADDPTTEDEPTAIEVRELDDHADIWETGKEERILISATRAAQALGCRDLADLASKTRERLPARPESSQETVVWLIHPLREQRSHALPLDRSPLPNMAIAVCAAREGDFTAPLLGAIRPDPATIAHELPHLFGASDKYGAPLTSFPDGWVSEFDIMRLDVDSLNRLRIDRLTAEELGWDASSDPETPPENRQDRNEPGSEDHGRNSSSPHSARRERPRRRHAKRPRRSS